MSSMKSILAATDLSAPSRHAADRAALLARANGGKLTLAHALGDTALDDLRRFVGDGEPTKAVVKGDARDRLHAIAVRLGQRHEMTVAEQIDADLLVTGTRGAGFFRGVVTGSTAERVARRSARPVLMVRQVAHEAYQRVLIPVDFSAWAAPSIELAQRVAPGADLVLLHAVQIPFESRLRLVGVTESQLAAFRGTAINEAHHRLDEVAAAAGLSERWVGLVSSDGADPWMQIVRQELEQDCDLIVIGKHGRNVLEELLLGSTTRIVIAEGSADVLVSTHSAT